MLESVDYSDEDLRAMALAAADVAHVLGCRCAPTVAISEGEIPDTMRADITHEDGCPLLLARNAMHN